MFINWPDLSLTRRNLAVQYYQILVKKRKKKKLTKVNGLPHTAWGYSDLKWMQLKKFKFKTQCLDSSLASSSFILSQCCLKWSLIVHLVFCMKCDLAHGLVFYSLISMVNILPIIKHEVLNLWRWCWTKKVLLHF